MLYFFNVQSVSLYIHIPFCVHRCAYCDFNTYTGLEALMPEYNRALCAEIEALSGMYASQLLLHSIYFGGGTPSLVPVSHLTAVFEAINKAFTVTPVTEITLEANPGTVTREYLRELVRLGVNRLSLGMQSAHAAELVLLERNHTMADVIQAVEWARQAGIAQLNLDLIFGLPDQTVDRWASSLAQAVALGPEHLSLYALTLEHGTRMEHRVSRGLLAAPDADLAADMYEWAVDFLEGCGYVQYEISNWAQKDGDGGIKACRHNLQYWRNLPYFGVGAGAHGYVGGIRTANVLSPKTYIRRFHSAGDRLSFPRTFATAWVHKNQPRDEMAETLVMGLRLTQEGVSKSVFRRRFGGDLTAVYGAEIDELIGLGLLEWAGDDQERLRLTARGRLLGNQVFLRFL